MHFGYSGYVGIPRSFLRYAFAARGDGLIDRDTEAVRFDSHKFERSGHRQIQTVPIDVDMSPICPQTRKRREGCAEHAFGTHHVELPLVASLHTAP